MARTAGSGNKKAYNLKELRDMAAEKNIPGRSKMTKAELIAALGLSQNAPQPEPKQETSKAVKEMARKMTAGAPPTSGAPGKKEEPKGVFIDWGPDIPQTYEQDTVSLLVKDPEWLYAYWELTGGNSRHIVSSLGGSARAILRLERADGNFVDIETGVSMNWYLKVDPGLSYRAIIGFKDPGGGFHPVAASRLAKTPRVGLSDVVDTKWMIVRRKLDELLRYMGGFPRAGSMFAVEAQSWRMVKLFWASMAPARR